MYELIVFIGRPRTGSTYLANLLSSGSHMLAKSEIFYPKYPMGLTDLEISRATGKDVSGLNRQQKADLIHSEPDSIISYLKRVSRNRGLPVSFKIFDQHLPEPDLSRLILKDESILKIFIDRDIFSSYVSRLKASSIRESQNVNTTELRVTIKKRPLVNWIERYSEWYKSCQFKIGTQDTLFVPYEVFTSGTNTENYAMMAKIFASKGIKLGGEPNIDQIKYKKQDRNADPAASVINWSEFSDDPVMAALHIDRPQYFFKELDK